MARYVQLSGRYVGDLGLSAEDVMKQIQDLLSKGAKEIKLDAEQMEALKKTAEEKEPGTWEKILASLTDVAQVGLKAYFESRAAGKTTPIPQQSFGIPADLMAKLMAGAEGEKPAVPGWVWGAGIGVVALAGIGITAAVLLKE